MRDLLIRRICELRDDPHPFRTNDIFEPVMNIPSEIAARNRDKWVTKFKEYNAKLDKIPRQGYEDMSDEELLVWFEKLTTRMVRWR
jgi:hypothetical protein